ncbi:MAG: hypothetical protein ACRER5_20200, partial [Pseudomonas sp.]
MTLNRQRAALSHLDQLEQRSTLVTGPQTGMSPAAQSVAVLPRPKVYRLVLHSSDRIGGTPTTALFDLGNLPSAWQMHNQNLDAGPAHYNLVLQHFHITCQTATPAIVEI